MKMKSVGDCVYRVEMDLSERLVVEQALVRELRFIEEQIHTYHQYGLGFPTYWVQEWDKTCQVWITVAV